MEPTALPISEENNKSVDVDSLLLDMQIYQSDLLECSIYVKYKGN